MLNIGMNRHYQVITVGESTVDAFMKLAEPNHTFSYDKDANSIGFTLGDKIDVERFDFCLGGNATNVAVGLTRLGVKATLCSETGDDEFSIKIRNALATERIERLFVHQIHGASNFAVVINFKGDRTVFVQDVEREHDFQLTDVTCDMVYLTSLGRKWQDPYRKIVNFVKEQEASLAFNPGSRQIHEGRETVEYVIRHASILFVNKEEGEHLLFGKAVKDSSNDKEYIKELITKLRKMGPNTVILTNGKHGSYAMDEADGFHFQAMSPGEAIERTGAGDAYASGFLAAAAQGECLPNAMQWGSTNSASVVAHIGAQAGLLSKDEMQELA
jgi:sugar/nucleoside kinase (ribokinase family)